MSSRQCWRNLKFVDFISRLQTRELCTPCDKDACTDNLMNQFNKVITGLLDKMAPVKEVTLHEHHRQPYFDGMVVLTEKKLDGSKKFSKLRRLLHPDQTG